MWMGIVEITIEIERWNCGKMSHTSPRRLRLEET